MLTKKTKKNEGEPGRAKKQEEPGRTKKNQARKKQEESGRTKRNKEESGNSQKKVKEPQNWIFNPNLITLIGTCTEKTHYGHDLGRVRTALKSSRRSFRAQYSCGWGRSVGSREETRRHINVRRML